MNMKSRMLLYQTISASFCVIVIMSNILSAKMVKFPWIDFSIPAGLITYPLTFLISDLVTEIFGAKRARMMIYMALGMNLLSLAIIQLGLSLPTKVSKEQTAFHEALDLGGIRIFSSLVSYALSQIVDVQLYAAIKRWTDSKWLWLRNNGSKCVSHPVATITIDLLSLWWGFGMPLSEVLPIMLFSYLYKSLFSLACTPLFYLLVFLIRDKWQATLSMIRSAFIKPI